MAGGGGVAVGGWGGGRAGGRGGWGGEGLGGVRGGGLCVSEVVALFGMGVVDLACDRLGGRRAAEAGEV